MGNACEERVLGEQGQGTWVIRTEARLVWAVVEAVGDEGDGQIRRVAWR